MVTVPFGKHTQTVRYKGVAGAGRLPSLPIVAASSANHFDYRWILFIACLRTLTCSIFTLALYSVKESRIKVVSFNYLFPTYLELRVNTLCQDDEGQESVSVTESMLPLVRWLPYYDFGTLA